MGEGTDLKITDLAAAPLLLPQVKLDGRAALPAAAMSPDVLCSRKPGVADDIYALGALIYDLLTSQPLFSSGDIPTQVASVVPPSVQDRRAQTEISAAPVPQPWEDWLAAARSKDAKPRPSLNDLNVLLRTGQFGGKTSPGTAARPAAISPSGVTYAAAEGSSQCAHPRLLGPRGSGVGDRRVSVQGETAPRVQAGARCGVPVRAGV